MSFYNCKAGARCPTFLSHLTSDKYVCTWASCRRLHRVTKSFLMPTVELLTCDAEGCNSDVQYNDSGYHCCRNGHVQELKNELRVVMSTCCHAPLLSLHSDKSCITSHSPVYCSKCLSYCRLDTHSVISCECGGTLQHNTSLEYGVLMCNACHRAYYLKNSDSHQTVVLPYSCPDCSIELSIRGCAMWCKECGRLWRYSPIVFGLKCDACPICRVPYVINKSDDINRLVIYSRDLKAAVMIKCPSCGLSKDISESDNRHILGSTIDKLASEISGTACRICDMKSGYHRYADMHGMRLMGRVAFGPMSDEESAVALSKAASQIRSIFNGINTMPSNLKKAIIIGVAYSVWKTSRPGIVTNVNVHSLIKARDENAIQAYLFSQLPI